MHGQPAFTLIRALSDDALRQRIVAARASVGDTPYTRELLSEQARRNDARRCPECHVHQENGHLLTCKRGARTGRNLRLVT